MSNSSTLACILAHIQETHETAGLTLHLISAEVAVEEAV